MNWTIFKNRYPYTYEEFKKHIENNNIDASEGDAFEHEIRHFLALKGYEVPDQYQKACTAYEIKLRVEDEPLLKGLPFHVHKESIIRDCKDITEFAHKYRKPERFTQRGEEYVNGIMQSHQEEIEKDGYTAISMYDNITGRYIVFVPPVNANQTILQIGSQTIRMDVNAFAKDLHELHLTNKKYAAPLKFGMLNAKLVEATTKMLTASVNKKFHETDQDLFKLRINQFISDTMSAITKQVIKIADIVI